MSQGKFKARSERKNKETTLDYLEFRNRYSSKFLLGAVLYEGAIPPTSSVNWIDFIIA